MGDVYLVQHPRMPRREALKMLPADVSADPEFRARFSREADLAASLWHPHIVGVHDRGEYEGRLWIAMDYVEGTDAARLLANRYPAGMPQHDAPEIVTAVAEALDYAHEHKLLHRDVKPANILLTDLPEVDAVSCWPTSALPGRPTPAHWRHTAAHWRDQHHGDEVAAELLGVDDGAAYGHAKFERLRQVKRVYDPHNLFRFNHNMPPTEA
jgi:serine/threonine protein kinase